MEAKLGLSIDIISRSSERSNNDNSDSFSILNGTITSQMMKYYNVPKTEDIEIILI